MPYHSGNYTPCTVNYQKHCPGCFRRKDGSPVCAQCGYDESAPRSPLFLPHGVMLAGQYRVGKVLGRPGGFGVTYLGWDIYLQQRVAIKEYLPPDMAARVPDAQNITVHTNAERKTFENGKEQFLREARIVARLDHPNVVRVRAFFNANDTAYMVMDFYEGMSLDTYFGQVKPTLDFSVAGPLVQMVLDGLSYVHERGVIHRDVKPHNVYLAAVGKPILLDFGAARKAIGTDQRSVSIILTEGYAPLEQYQRLGKLGAWTDVYGCGALLFRMLTGRAPPVAVDRIGTDPLEKDDYPDIPNALKPVLRKALSTTPEGRYQTAAEFKAALSTVLASTATADVAAMARAPHKQALPEVAPPITYSKPRRSVSLPAPTEITLEVPPAPEPILPQRPPLPNELAPHDDAPPSRAATPEGIIRTRSTVVPSARLPQWAVPSALVATVLAVVVYVKPWVRPGNTAPAAAANTVVIAAEPTPAASGFDLSALPPLATDAIPILHDLPAGAYARTGTTALQLPAFRMSETEITVDNFTIFATRTQYNNPTWDSSPCLGGARADARWDRPGYSQTGSHPVVCVDWSDATAYAAWLSQETGRHFRLATDAEWEYAAAGGSATNYWWGSAVDAEHAACADCGRSHEAPQHPFIASSLGQNGFGLFGTAGNVREWTCSPESEPLAIACALPTNTGQRVVRGGAWNDPASGLATTSRSLQAISTRNTYTGFRIVEDLGR